VAVSNEHIAMEVVRRARAKTIRDPAWFFKNVLNESPLAWQLRGVNAALDPYRKTHGIKVVTNRKALPRISVRSCHGTGKTQWLAQLMHTWNFLFPTLIACTAPKEAQLKRRLWPRYRKVMKNAIEEYRQNIIVNAGDVQCYGDPDWGAVAETASDPDNLAGYHDTPQLFLVDEASAKRLDPMFPVIEGALTTPGSVSVEIGNPTRTEGEFYNHHNKKGTKELYYRMHIKPGDAPELISQDWIDAMIAKYGVDSPIVKIRVFGEFAAYDDYILIPYDYIIDALDLEEEPDGSVPRLRVTVDVADGGADGTVVTAARHYKTFTQVLKQRQFYFPPSESPVKAARAALEMYRGFGGSNLNGDDFVIDANGVGAGTAGNLMDKSFTGGEELTVIQYRGGETQHVISSKYRNQRVQNYITLYEWFRDGFIRFSPGAVDDEDELAAQLLSIKRNVDNERVDDIQTRRQMKQDGIDSPDRADSLQLQCMRVLPTSTVNKNAGGISVLSEAMGANADW